MKVALGKFAREGLEDLRGADLVGGVEVALRYYVDVLRGSQPPPALLRGLGPGLPGPDSTEVELCIEPPLGAALERDAERQGATVGELATHAILVYLAARDRTEDK